MPTREIRSCRILVGMEIHIQLATRSKMFTSAPSGAANFGADPNTLVDEQVLGLPGVLPVMNKRAVELAIVTGLALGCRITRHSKWDRKSYYYPDLPKNYQISQYDLPLCKAGRFDLRNEDGSVTPIRIRRAHLEEDAGKLLHEAPGGYQIDHSIVDLNRAGTPLLEIVTEPDFSSPRQVVLFAQELQRLVRFLGISEGQMQMGHMRFEPNINVHITDAEGQIHKTAITEIKNLNSFSVLERATTCEINRQIQQWIDTGSLGRKSTYGWDESTESTFHQRDKEEANDYRYFPDPDLMPVEVDDAWLERLKGEVSELPAARKLRYVESFKLAEADADILADQRQAGDYYEQVLADGADPVRVARLLVNVLATIANRTGKGMWDLGIAPGRVAEVAGLIDQSKIAAASALPLLEKLATADGSAEKIAAELGLLQSSDTGPIDAAIDSLIAQNPKSLQDYKSGKQAALGALVGMIMKNTKGLNPKLVQERLKARLI